MLKIWGRTTSANVMKVLWCCTELNEPYERVDVGGPYGGNDDPAYRAMNPNGRVPTVEENGVVMWESNTIVRYHLHDPQRRDSFIRATPAGAPMSSAGWTGSSPIAGRP